MRLSTPALLIAAILMTVTLSVGIVGGCGTGPGEKRPAAGSSLVSSVKKADGIEVSLRSEPRVAKTGGEFSLTLNVRNLSGGSRDFTLTTTQTYEFLAFAEDGSEVWRWSNGMMFAQVITPKKMSADDSLMFKSAWNPKGLPTGKYKIQGYFLGMKNLRPSITIELTP